MESLRDRLVRHEGLRLTPYRDTADKLTIGVGRNLDDVGITKEEALCLLDHDIAKATADADAAFPWLMALGVSPHDVIVEMVFNMGLGRVTGFHKMLSALQRADFVEASNQMLQSLWASQVGDRAKELAAILSQSKSA